jgi:hypothetical protein
MRIVPVAESEDWLNKRRVMLAEQKPNVSFFRNINGIEKSNMPSPTDSKAYTHPTIEANSPINESSRENGTALMSTFKNIPKIGDRFLGSIFNDYKGEIWLEIPGLDADDLAYAVVLRSEQPDLGKVKEGQKLRCEVVEIIEELRGYWRIKCKIISI